MKGEPLCVCSNPGSGTCRDSLNVAGTYLLIGFPKVRRILKGILCSITCTETSTSDTAPPNTSILNLKKNQIAKSLTTSGLW